MKVKLFGTLVEALREGYQVTGNDTRARTINLAQRTATGWTFAQVSMKGENQNA